jgi:hypothetical protein
VTDDLLQDSLLLEYQGGTVDEGRMDAYEAAKHIMAFSDFLTVVSRHTYGDKADIKTEIQGFRGNSFDIEFLFQIAGPIATMLSASPLTASDMIDMVKQSVDALIHLRGRPPKDMRHVEGNASMIEIENNEGVVQTFNGATFNIIGDPTVGAAVENFIKGPLDSGVQQIAISSRRYNEAARIGQADSGSFVPVEIERPLTDNEINVAVTLESPSFKDGNKWKFDFGGQSIWAEMTDKEFLSRVDDGERFGKGDVLRVTLEIIQTSIIDKLKTDYRITEVIEHRPAAQQATLFD